MTDAATCSTSNTVSSELSLDPPVMSDEDYIKYKKRRTLEDNKGVSMTNINESNNTLITISAPSSSDLTVARAVMQPIAQSYGWATSVNFKNKSAFQMKVPQASVDKCLGYVNKFCPKCETTVSSDKEMQKVSEGNSGGKEVTLKKGEFMPADIAYAQTMFGLKTIYSNNELTVSSNSSEAVDLFLSFLKRRK